MLALREYFWTWGQTPTPTPTPSANLSNAGGGGKKKRDYEPASADFWDVRERYLRRFVKPIVERVQAEAPVQVPVEPGYPHQHVDVLPILLMQQAMEAAMIRAQKANSRQELRDTASRAMQFALDISKIRQQYTNRATALLLLDVL